MSVDMPRPRIGERLMNGPAGWAGLPAGGAGVVGVVRLFGRYVGTGPLYQ